MVYDLLDYIIKYYYYYYCCYYCYCCCFTIIVVIRFVINFDRLLFNLLCYFYEFNTNVDQAILFLFWKLFILILNHLQIIIILYVKFVRFFK